MARDFDFKPKRSAPPQAPLSKRARIHSPRLPRGKNQLMFFVIIAIVLIGFSVAFFSSNSKVPTDDKSNSLLQIATPSSSPTVTPVSTQVNLDQKAGDYNLFSNDPTEFTVQVYNAGAGEDTTNAMIARLKEKGYSVSYLGNSQFIYPTTDIWYKKENERQAQEIAVALADREVKLKESKISGVFEVLVYIGQK